MAMFLSNAEVRSLLPMDKCIEVTERVFLDESEDMASNQPRQHLPLPAGFHRTIAGIVHGFGVYGMKTYGGGPGGGGARYLLLLYGLEDAKIRAIIEARDIGQIRTGAVSAVATKHMARAEATSIGSIGTGWEARAQLEAISLVRKLSLVKAYSRSAENRLRYASDMRERLGLDVQTVESAEECARDVDILVTVTNANEPLVEGGWLRPGTHINGVGATGPVRRELDDDVVARVDVAVVENMAQASIDCGELLHAADQGVFDWERVVELKSVVAGNRPGRRNDDSVTLFDSLGVATEDIASAAYVVEQAKAKGVGQELPF